MACGSAPSVLSPGELRVGVDPTVEGAVMAAEFETRGFHISPRVEGAGFYAFGGSRDETTIVRVLTEHGLRLAVDAPSESHARSKVYLSETVLDVNENGHDELIVFTEDPLFEQPCHALIEVMDGQLRELRARGLWELGVFCLHNPARLVGSVALPRWSVGVVPTLDVQLDGQLRVLHASTHAPEGSAAARFAVAVEAAVSLRLSGASVDSQRARFDAIAPCDEAELREMCLEFREFLTAGVYRQD